MVNCVTCGDKLHPERAEKYHYCTRRECRQENARALSIVAVGVNKAADQFVVLDERTEKEMASGRYKKVPETPASIRRRSSPGRVQTPEWDPTLVPRSSAHPARPRWSEAQENLALTYRAMGLKPDEIVKKLGVSPYLVTQILLSAKGRRKR